MATTDEKWVIDKLDDSNWTTWKFQMKHLLLAKGVWEVVDGTEELAEDATAAARAEFLKKSQKAFSSIVLAIKTSQLYLVTSYEQPREAWDALRNHFERDTLANKLFLKKQYFRMEMKEGTSIEKHLKRMKELTDRLAAIGAPIAEEDQVVTLLGSLPKSYSTLVTALEARVDGISLNYVQQALAHEEQKMLVRGHSGNSDAQRGDAALFGGESKRKFKPRKPICYGCQQPGHFRRDCPKAKKGPSHKAETAGEEDKESESEEGSAFAASQDGSQDGKWLVDSGASSHMTWDKELLTDYQEFEVPEKVGLGDGRTVDAVGFGSVHLRMCFKVSQPKKFVMYKVLYVPKLACNLFSVRAAVSKGDFIKFGHSRCWIRDGNGHLHGMGTLVDKLYQLDCEAILSEAATLVNAQKDNNFDVWHFRLGHASEQCIKNMSYKKLATGIKLPKRAKLSFCEGCIAGKMKRKPFKAVGEIRSKRKLQLVHSDVCGPMPTDSIGGNKYFVTFIDDYSRCCAVYFLKSKSEVPEKFKEFEARVFNDCSQRVSTLRSDNGGEYLSKEFRSYLKSKGIRQELTVPHSPEQNGVAERMNRTLMETARSMMAHAGLPERFWAEAVETAAYIRNRTPTTAIKDTKTPMEVWNGNVPNIANMKVFGCMAYAHVPDVQRKKLDKKAVKLRFVGYSIQSKAYRLLDEKTSKIYIRRDVIFNEQDFGQKTEEVPKGDLLETIEVEQNPDIESETEEEQAESEERRQSERTRRPPVRFGIDEYADTATASIPHVAYVAHQIAEPNTMDEAFAGDLSNEWKEAADLEYDSLLQNETWDLVELPRRRETIGSKWVFKIKYKGDGEIERFKARLKMLEKYNLQDAKPVSTPADSNVRLRKDDNVSKAVDSVMYQSIVGSLLYAAVATRPDISQAVGVVSKFSSKPSEAHLTAVKRILRYLKGSLDITLQYRKTEDGSSLIGYSDADYAGDLDDRHSTSGNLFLISNGPVSWLSKKQPIVTLSTCEAEYVALSTATQEAVWIKRLLSNFHVSQKQATVIMEDNQGAICIAKNPVVQARTKHIDIRHHYIREAVSDGRVSLQYCPTEEMIADIFTKPLPKAKFEKLRRNMGLKKLMSSPHDKLSGSVRGSN